MENQHRKIKGYRELSEAEIALMNRVKESGAGLQALIADLRKHAQSQYDAMSATENQEDRHAEFERLLKADPHRWLYAAEGDLQTALMKLTRSVAQPTFF